MWHSCVFRRHAGKTYCAITELKIMFSLKYHSVLQSISRCFPQTMECITNTLNISDYVEENKMWKLCTLHILFFLVLVSSLWKRLEGHVCHLSEGWTERKSNRSNWLWQLNARVLHGLWRQTVFIVVIGESESLPTQLVKADGCQP